MERYLDELEEHLDESGRTYLATAREGTKNAVDVTNTAEEISTVVVESESPSESVAVKPIISERVEETDAAYPDATVSIDGSIPDLDVRGSKMLAPVVRNLLTNGIEHNDRPTPRVEVSCSRRDQFVQIRIEDDGPGISDHLKTEIFSEGATGFSSEGTGIGLYLVSTFVDRHGGTVHVDDADGTDAIASDHDERGSVFTIELPIAS